MQPVTVKRGNGPVILGMPHVGTYVPPDTQARLNAEGRILRDTDWHIEKLYDGLLPGATVVQANFHRYVIDANRDPSGKSLYPGAATTELVPTTDFDGNPIWQVGSEPNAQDISRRLSDFHAPYHRALADEIARVKALHGVAILFDCHSIRSQIPRLFEGTLPDFNIGTDNGTTCDARLEQIVLDVCKASGGSTVLNGRFRGGWTTRHYGRPNEKVHAIQMELAQSSHLNHEVPPFELSAEKLRTLRPVLGDMLARLFAIAPTLTA